MMLFEWYSIDQLTSLTFQFIYSYFFCRCQTHFTARWCVKKTINSKFTCHSVTGWAAARMNEISIFRWLRTSVHFTHRFGKKKVLKDEFIKFQVFRVETHQTSTTRNWELMRISMWSQRMLTTDWTAVHTQNETQQRRSKQEFSSRSALEWRTKFPLFRFFSQLSLWSFILRKICIDWKVNEKRKRVYNFVDWDERSAWVFYDLHFLLSYVAACKKREILIVWLF